MPKKNPKKTSQPPSLFETLDLFQPAAGAAGGKPAAKSPAPKAPSPEQRTTNHEPRHPT